MTDFGPTSHYLGMEVMRNNNTITVTQTVYIDQLLAAHQMSNCNTATTPMVEGLCLAPVSDDYSHSRRAQEQEYLIENSK